MSVESFDPGKLSTQLSPSLVAEILQLAAVDVNFELDEGGELRDKQLDLDADQQARFGAVATHQGWAEVAVGLADVQLQALIRFFTLGELRYPAWHAGDKSPVIGLVREMKQRKSYGPEITRWIKAHTKNKFLPHGNLMARL